MTTQKEAIEKISQIVGAPLAKGDARRIREIAHAALIAPTAYERCLAEIIYECERPTEDKYLQAKIKLAISQISGA